MKRTAFLTTLVAFCIAICAGSIHADINTYTIHVGEFSKLKVNNDIEVNYVCLPDSAGFAVFTCDDRFADAFLFDNKNGTLKISSNTDYERLNNDLPIVTVYSTYLVYAENQSKYTLNIKKVAPCPQVTFKQVGNGAINVEEVKATKVKATIATGNGIINLSGEADKASYEMVGTGKIIADDLCAEEVTCTVFGTGSIGCWPIEKLNVKGLGSTTVYYKGNPSVIKKTGIAKIEQMP